LVGDRRQVAREPRKLELLAELHRGERPLGHARVVLLHLRRRARGAEVACAQRLRSTPAGRRTVTEVIQGIHLGISDLFCHISQASDSGTPGASTRALSQSAAAGM
jgi:hypothetical protein